MNTAEHLLKEWGRWSRQHSGIMLGFPSRGVIGRVMDEGPGAGQATNKDIPMPNLVRITEDVLLKMPHDLRVALELKYVARKPDRIACLDTHCGRTVYRQRVVAGVWYLQGHIDCLGIKLFDSGRSSG